MSKIPCDRCGNLRLSGDLHDILERQVCEECVEMPGVDFLEETRLKYWGKRDGFVWLFGLLGTIGSVVGAVIISLALIATLTTGLSSDVAGTACILFIVICRIAINGSYLLLYQWARPGIIVMVIVEMIGIGAINAIFQGAAVAGAGAGQSLFALLFVVAAYRSPRNKLAFKVDVTDEELDKVRKTFNDNPMAGYSVGASIVGFLIPLVGLLGIFLGVKAFKKVDPDAWPPIGAKGKAIAGVVIGVLALLKDCILVVNALS